MPKLEQSADELGKLARNDVQIRKRRQRIMATMERGDEREQAMKDLRREENEHRRAAEDLVADVKRGG